jgi:hypothetical protein
MQSAAIDLLHAQIADADTQWSLGTFGGIAEFSRDRDEKVSLTRSDTGAAAVTARGGIAIELSDDCRPFAFECITRSSWSQRVALCLPTGACTMNRRTVLTELDVDRDALQPEHRGSTLFDLGLGALQADLCVRIDDHATVAQLRRHTGRSVFDPANPAMGLLLETNPHRVFISRIGRIEVYQPIPPPSGTSPDGPHTHVLPKLLKSGRTHAATEPYPRAGFLARIFIPSIRRAPEAVQRATIRFNRCSSVLGFRSFLRSNAASWTRSELASRLRTWPPRWIATAAPESGLLCAN